MDNIADRAEAVRRLHELVDRVAEPPESENRPGRRGNPKESASTAKRREASLKSCEKNGLPEWKEFNEGFQVSLMREIRPEFQAPVPRLQIVALYFLEQMRFSLAER